MTILSDSDILSLIETQQIKINPYEEKNVQSASIDLTLSNSFLSIKEMGLAMIDMDVPIEYQTYTTDEYILHPGHFVLASTVESVELDSMISGSVSGRSSIGRLGLFVENAGWIDPNFKGNITLELFNANSIPIKLKSGRRICQLILSWLSTPSSKPYNGKYQNSKGTVGSKIYKDEDSK